MHYQELLLLRAARKTGVLEAVGAGAGTPAVVAAETGVTERAARIVLEAMAEQGYLANDENGYELTDETLGFVDKTDVRSMGSAPFRIDCGENWIRLPETMRTEEAPERSDDWTVDYVGSMADTDPTIVRSTVTAAVHRKPDAERVLDAGGGSGIFSEEFAGRGFDVTLFEKPEVAELDLDLPDSVELVGGDLTEELPDGFDLVFGSRLAHNLSPEENRRVLANAYDALEPGGAVVLTDYLRDHFEGAALFGAHIFAQTGSGETYPEAKFEDWFREAGFEDFEVRDVPGTHQQAITGYRPRD